MKGLSDAVRPAAGGYDPGSVAGLLGGRRLLGRSVDSPLDAHAMLLDGLPGQALAHFIQNLAVLQMTPALERAMGMSLRTFQRRRDAPAMPLNAEQSGRTWTFATVLAKAIAVFGSQEAAERWLERPATGLDRQRPLDLLATPAGVELVEDFLQRLEYGVYV